MNYREFLIGSILTVFFMAACGGPDKPAWLVNDPGDYDETSHVFARGEAYTRSQAVVQARTAIFRQFSNTTGELDSVDQGLEEMQIDPLIRRMIENALTVNGYWEDEKSGRHHVMVVLERRKATMPLWHALDELNRAVDFILKQANADRSRAEGIRRIDLALDLQKSRALLFGKIIQLQPDASLERAAERRQSEIESRLASLLTGMKFNVEMQGDLFGMARGGMVRAMVGDGLQLAPAFDRELLVRGSVELSRNPGRVEASALFKAFDGQGRLLESFNLSVQGRDPETPHTVLEDLGQTAARRLMARLQNRGDG